MCFLIAAQYRTLTYGTFKCTGLARKESDAWYVTFNTGTVHYVRWPSIGALANNRPHFTLTCICQSEKYTALSTSYTSTLPPTVTVTSTYHSSCMCLSLFHCLYRFVTSHPFYFSYLMTQVYNSYQVFKDTRPGRVRLFLLLAYCVLPWCKAASLTALIDLFFSSEILCDDVYVYIAMLQYVGVLSPWLLRTTRGEDGVARLISNCADCCVDGKRF